MPGAARPPLQRFCNGDTARWDATQARRCARMDGGRGWKEGADERKIRRGTARAAWASLRCHDRSATQMGGARSSRASAFAHPVAQAPCSAARTPSWLALRLAAHAALHLLARLSPRWLSMDSPCAAPSGAARPRGCYAFSSGAQTGGSAPPAACIAPKNISRVPPAMPRVGGWDVVGVCVGGRGGWWGRRWWGLSSRGRHDSAWARAAECTALCAWEGIVGKQGASGDVSGPPRVVWCASGGISRGSAARLHPCGRFPWHRGLCGHAPTSS